MAKSTKIFIYDTIKDALHSVIPDLEFVETYGQNGNKSEFVFLDLLQESIINSLKSENGETVKQEARVQFQMLYSYKEKGNKEKLAREKFSDRLDKIRLAIESIGNPKEIDLDNGYTQVWDCVYTDSQNVEESNRVDKRNMLINGYVDYLKWR